MPNDYKKMNSLASKISQDTERLQRVLNPLHLNRLQELDRMLNPPWLKDIQGWENLYNPHLKHIRELEEMLNPPHLKLLQELESASKRYTNLPQLENQSLLGGYASQFGQTVLVADSHCQSLIGTLTATGASSLDFGKTHQTWLDCVAAHQSEMASVSQGIQNIAKEMLDNVSSGLNATSLLAANINFEGVESQYSLSGSMISALENSMLQAAAAHGKLLESVSGLDEITSLPTFILPESTREIYYSNYALETIFPDENEDIGHSDERNTELVTQIIESSSCLILLNKVNSDLAKAYIGARAALYGNNIDRSRHVLISLRELSTHILHYLAPDKLVLPWIASQEKKCGLLHNERPTRQSRILYICRNINNGPFCDFMKADVQASLKLFDIFQRVHKLQTNLNDDQLRAIFIKTDSFLQFLIQTSLNNKQN